METNLYARLQWKIISLTLLVTFTPLLLLGVIIYRQFAGMYTAQILEQIRYRAEFPAAPPSSGRSPTPTAARP